MNTSPRVVNEWRKCLTILFFVVPGRSVVVHLVLRHGSSKYRSNKQRSVGLEVTGVIGKACIAGVIVNLAA